MPIENTLDNLRIENTLDNLRIENTLDNLRIETSKLKGIVENLKEKAKNTKINRNECKHLLFELETIFLSVKQHFSELLKIATEQETKQYKMNMLSLLKIIFKTFQNLEVERKFDNLINKIHLLASYKIDNQYYDDTEIRNEIYDITTDSDYLVNEIDLKLFKPMQRSISGLSKIAELVYQNILNLNENWAAATCYLAAIDIAVNKKREELGLIENKEKEKKISFYDRFDELITNIESQQGEISKVVKQLPKPFWKIRRDVIHYGHSLTQEELELIVTWSKKIVKELSQIPLKDT